MGNKFPSKAVLAKESLFPHVTVPRKHRTIRPATKTVTFSDVHGEKKAYTFVEEQGEILDPELHEPRKKHKLMVRNTAKLNDKDSAVHERARSSKKRKQAVEDCNDDVYIPRFRVRGGTRGNRTSNSGKLDSKTFQECMDHIWSTCPEERQKSFSYLDCLWFNLYSQKASKRKVLSWAEKKKDEFSKKYVIVPILMWSHWSLLILCNFGESSQSPCMLLLDSLQSGNPKGLEPLIRRFVSDLYNLQPRRCKIPLLVPKVPQQRDGVECGRVVLYYLHLFLEGAPEEFSISEGYPYFMKEDWFRFDDFDNFCKILEEESKPSSSSNSDEDVVEVSSQDSIVIS